jgi:cytochrome c oxidase assembly factor CtaG
VRAIPIVPIQTLRLILGLLAMFFAYALGRTLARLRRLRQPTTKAITWILRTVVALFAVFWTGGFDALGILLLSLAGLALAAGIYFETRPRKVEETHLFPQD